MFHAINKKTQQTVSSLEVFNNPSYQTPYDEEWIADPDEIRNWDEIKEKYPEIKVVYVRKREVLNFNGTKFLVAPHFRIPNAKELGINIIPESREHRLAKNWIFNRLIEDDLQLWYSSVNKPFKYVNPIKLLELPLDKIKISIETSVYNVKRRIADVILPFVYTHPLFGNGIVFEIQFNKQRDSTRENRTFDWAYRGYSVCWLYFDDFNQITDYYIDLKDKSVRVDAFAGILKYSNKEQIKRLKFEIQEQCRLLDDKKKDFEFQLDDSIINAQNKLIQGCEEFSDVKQTVNYVYERLNKIEEQLKFYNIPTCPDCNVLMTWKKSKYGGFWGCSNYPQCKRIISIPDGED